MQRRNFSDPPRESLDVPDHQEDDLRPSRGVFAAVAASVIVWLGIIGILMAAGVLS